MNNEVFINPLKSDVKSKLQFFAWLQFGYGTPQDGLMRFAVGGDWKNLSMEDTANKFEEIHGINIKEMSIFQALKTIREKWEETNGSFAVIRKWSSKSNSN